MARKATHWHIVLFEKGTNTVLKRELASSFGSERQALEEVEHRRMPLASQNFGVQECIDVHRHTPSGIR